MALYTVTVTNHTQGWSLSATEDETWDPAAKVILIDPLTVTWGFVDEVIPGQLEPFTATVNIAGRTATDLPAASPGDLVTVDITRISVSGGVIFSQRMRVTGATADLTGRGAPYRARLSLALTDLSADWRALSPGVCFATRSLGASNNYGRTRWRERMAEVGWLVGYSVGAPTWWGDAETPAVWTEAAIDSVMYPIHDTFDGDAEENLTALINSHHPGDWNGHPHTWVTAYAPSGYPTGYEYMGPDSWQSLIINDRNTAVRILAVPASRRVETSTWPITVAVVAGKLTLVPVAPDPDDYCSLIALDADWCILPTRVAATRAGRVNFLTFEGGYVRFSVEEPVEGFPQTVLDADDSSIDRWDAADVAANGAVRREVPTQLNIWGTDNPFGINVETPELEKLAANLYTFAGATDDPWAVDGFEIRSELIPDDVADWLLPRIMPRIPGETGSDGRLVRHVTVYGADDALRFTGKPLTGFITGGTLTIQGGELQWAVTMTPGQPIWHTGAPPTITLGELQAAAGTLTMGDIAAGFTLADLEHTGA